jgi:hypothetical protein
MGEANKRRARDERWEQAQEAAREVSKVFVDSGLLVEAGWAAFRQILVPRDATPEQLRLLRTAFFAGAQHTFHGVICVLDEGEEITDSDMRRMDLANQELTTFFEQMKAMLVDEPGGAA